jgi:hypothetical protein
MVLNCLMESLHNSRLGDNEVIRLAPIIVRQQVFTALGTLAKIFINKPLYLPVAI